MNSDHFKNLSLSENILHALKDEGYEEPTPIQNEAIPEILAGKDILATAQTGTGKTAAFALPILHILSKSPRNGARHIRALILTPTRELALQIESSFINYGRYLPMRVATVIGGVPFGGQIKALKKTPDILVATPGRLLDLIKQGHAIIDRVETLVLDEADRMLDMGFINDVRQIISKLPSKRQTLFFSATLCGDIGYLASDILNHPVRIEITPPSSVAENIDQKIFFVEQGNKRDLLSSIMREGNVRRALVFVRTKRQADRITRQLTDDGISADAIHSDKTQSARQKSLSAFDKGRIKVLVGTDIISRGIDVDGISHVINYELPNDPESYVHRIGRTARAGACGTAMSFCSAEDVPMLKGIEKLTKCPLTAITDHTFHSSSVAAIHQRINTPAPEQERWGRKRSFKSKKSHGRHAGV